MTTGNSKPLVDFPFIDGDVVAERSRSFFYPGGPHAILLVHGFAGTIDGQRALGKFLFTKGFTVLGLRLPGHGTAVEDLAKTNATDWQQAVTDAVQWLRQQHPRVSIIGASLGGNLALCQAVDHHNVDKIVLLSTPLKVRGQWWKQLAIPVLLPFKKYAKKSWVKNQEERQRRIASGSYLSVSLRAFKSMLELLSHTRHILSRVTIPVLLIYSKTDEVIQPKSATWLFKHLSSVHKKLLWVATHDHHPHESEKREEIFDHIHHFLVEQ